MADEPKPEVQPHPDAPEAEHKKDEGYVGPSDPPADPQPSGDPPPGGGGN